MNKQELIDEAIRDNDGVWPHEKGSVLNVAGPLNNSYTPFLSFDFSATEGEYGKYWITLCTRKEFEQRAKELGYGVDKDKTISVDSTEWYDYTAQKAVALPPVGDKSVSYLVGNNIWIGCEIAAHYGGGAIVAHNDGFTLVYKHELRPNNFYARIAEQERKRVVDAAAYFWVKCHHADIYDLFNQMYDAGFLKMPENKNG